MKLLIIRHAHAEERENWNALGKPDELRPLTKKGIFRFADVTMGMMKLIDHVDHIFTSELLRSIQTAELFAKGFPMATQSITEHLNAGRSIVPLIEFLMKQDRNKTYALVGHQPELSNLTSMLLSKHADIQFKFKKGGAAFIEELNGDWQMNWFLNSKQLAAIK
ncbi:MAG: phosphohistidine phosphatase SixA [Bacteriovoracaceae bacterium]